MPLRDQPSQRGQVLLIKSESIDTRRLPSREGQAGYEMHVAEDARSALALLAKGRFDVVVASTCPGAISCFEIMRKVATQESALRPSFVLVSGDVRIETLLASIRLRAANFLTTPAHPSEIADAIAQALDERRNRPQPPWTAPLDAADFLMKARDKRNAILNLAETDESKWQMLSQLYLAQADDAFMTVSEVCASSGAPYTSAARRLSALQAERLVIREPDARDQRRTLVKLTPATHAKMHAYFTWFGHTAAKIEAR